MALAPLPGLAPTPDDEEERKRLDAAVTPVPEPEPNEPAMPEPGRVPLEDSTTGGGSGAPPPPSAPVIAFPPRPEETNRTETKGPQRTIETSEPNPKIEKLQEEIEDSRQAGIQAGEAKLGVDTTLNDASARAAQIQADSARVRSNDIGLAEREKERKIAAAVQEENAARARLVGADKETRKGFWADKGGRLAEIASAFVVGLSTYAHVKSGGKGFGPAFDAFNDAEAKDREKKVAQLTLAKEAMARAEGGRDKAEAWFKTEIEKYDRAHEARVADAKNTLEVISKRLGTPAAQASFDQWRAGIDQKAAEDEQARWDKHAIRIREESAQTTTTRTVNKGGADEQKAAAPDPLIVRDLKGRAVGRVGDKSVAREIQDAHAATLSLRGAYQRLTRASAEVRNAVASGDVSKIEAAREKQKTAIMDVSGKLADARKTGVMNNTEFARTSANLERGWLEARDDFEKRIGTAITVAGQEYNNRLRAQGLPTRGADAPAAVPAKPPVEASDGTIYLDDKDATKSRGKGPGNPQVNTNTAPGAAKPEEKPEMSRKDAINKRARYVAHLKRNPKDPRADQIRARIKELDAVAGM